MKVIGHLNGIVAYREAVEEYQPERGTVQRDLAELVRTNYQFQVFPIFGPGIQMPDTLNFAGGKFANDGNSFAIAQLVMTQDGDIAACVTTDQADVVLSDLMRLLDENLGFKLQIAQKVKSYLSTVVVEFDRGLEQYINQLGRIAGIINRFRPGRPPFNIKRVGFGLRDTILPNNPLAAIEGGEFLIERRAGRPFEENRYFCSAPLSSGEHVHALEQIEAVVRGD
jgi:hypothetical protein